MPNLTELLNLVDECLQKKHRPDPELLKKHNVDPLNKDYQIKTGELVERSDVVHDILTYLAKEMIRMNKEKQDEIKGFIKYLERRIGQDIERLKNKTRIKEYYNHDFKELIEVLANNKINLNRESGEQLETEFTKSVNKLKPLIERIGATDNLIDQIVYKLYGLTESEIRIVKDKILQ